MNTAIKIDKEIWSIYTNYGYGKHHNRMRLMCLDASADLTESLYEGKDTLPNLIGRLNKTLALLKVLRDDHIDF